MSLSNVIAGSNRLAGRRRFVAGCGGLAAVSVVAPAQVLAAAKLDSGFSAAGFEAQLNQTFFADSASFGTVAMDLVEVKSMRTTAAKSPRIEQFSLIFRGQYLPMPSGVYGMASPSSSRFSLYLTALPLARGAAPQYRADFSLLR